MIKKKSKKKAGKAGSKKISPKKNVDAAKVREQIAGIVKSGAKKVTAAVLVHAQQGELGPAKYLFEMAGIFPAVMDGSISSAEEDSLAETLLQRLNLPTEPVRLDQDEETVIRPVTKQLGTGEELQKTDAE